jgi:hypothetical protein
MYTVKIDEIGCFDKQERVSSRLVDQRRKVNQRCCSRRLCNLCICQCQSIPSTKLVESLQSMLETQLEQFTRNKFKIYAVEKSETLCCSNQLKIHLYSNTSIYINQKKIKSQSLTCVIFYIFGVCFLSSCPNLRGIV